MAGVGSCNCDGNDVGEIVAAGELADSRRLPGQKQLQQDVVLVMVTGGLATGGGHRTAGGAGAIALL